MNKPNLTPRGRQALSASAKAAPRANNGEFTERVRSIQGRANALTAPYTREQAQEHDTAIQAMWREAHDLSTRVSRAVNGLYNEAGIQQVYQVQGRSRWVWPISQHEVVEQLTAAGRTSPAVDAFDEATRALEDLEVQIAEADLVYATRGRWARFFLVEGTNKHIHSSMECSTCIRGGSRTNFIWLPELSGTSEQDAVDAHGSVLCTVCFPSAPSEWTGVTAKPRSTRKDERPVCPGSGTSDWVPGTLRTGYVEGNAGLCSRCRERVVATSSTSEVMRKHRR